MELNNPNTVKSRRSIPRNVGGLEETKSQIKNFQDVTPAQPPPHPQFRQKGENCCKSCCKCVFGTKQLVSNKDKDSYMRTTLFELIIHLIYLTVCSFIVFGMISPTDYYYTKVLSDLFLDTPFDEETKTTFRTSANLKDFWKFTDTAMLNGLYWEEWYDDPGLSKPVAEQDRGILYENRILGRPRLRQIRVKSVSCPVQLVKILGTTCYPHYHKDYEEKAPFSTSTSGTPWTYHTEEELLGRQYWGKLHTYSGAGAYLLLETTRNEAHDLVKNLKQNLWITRATRVVFLEFTVYNSNINMFCVVKLAFEFSLSGGLVTSWSFRAVRLIRYVSDWDYFILGCEVLFILFTVYYTIQELIEICSLGIKKYLSDIWSYLDIFILLLSYICIAFSIYRLILIVDTIQPLMSNPNGFADFAFLGFWESQFGNAIAICLFFAWVKIFKYISFNATMSQLSTTLTRCAKITGGYTIIFFIVLFTFAQLGYLLFGSQVRDYSTIQDAIFSLLRLLLGEFNFHELEAANRVFGPIYFLSYVFFVFIVLLNVFLAIINDTYSEVKAEIEIQKSEFQITDYIKQRFRFLGSTIRHGRSSGGRTSATKSADDGKITQTELKNHLMNANFTESEVELFLARYELDRDHVLDQLETEQVISELEGEKSSYKALDHDKGDSNLTLGKNRTEFERIDKRITAMENSLTGMLRRMDTLISKMNTDKLT